MTQKVDERIREAYLEQAAVEPKDPLYWEFRRWVTAQQRTLWMYDCIQRSEEWPALFAAFKAGRNG